MLPAAWCRAPRRPAPLRQRQAPIATTHRI
jgi:hypothetical protein